MATKTISPTQIITYDTYINICNFYNIKEKDVYEKAAFTDVIEANNTIEIYNVHTNKVILILCSASKYTPQKRGYNNKKKQKKSAIDYYK